MTKWTIHVTDFGKIKKADVEVAPLTLFVGDNNSGKSYMMTLIYGLLNLRLFFDGYLEDEDSEEFWECCKVIDKFVKEPEDRRDSTYCFSREEIGIFQNLFNVVMKKKCEKFLHNLFNIKKMDIGGLSIEFPKKSELQLRIRYSYDEDNRPDEVVVNAIDEDTMMSGYRMDVDEIGGGHSSYEFYVAYVIESLLRKGIHDRKNDDVVYFPTARTGFLLTYKTLVGSAVEQKFGQEETDRTLLTRPNREFLRILSSMNTQNEQNEFEDIVHFIEENLLQGTVSVLDMPTHDILYTPKDKDEKLPLYITSAVVTELTPIVLFLKYVKIASLLIEEPEISLHPELQWQIARVMIRLVNAGIPIFTTTHSDIIIQHVNNMIKLRKVQGQEDIASRLGYNEEDFLSEELVAMYQFDADQESGTIVKRLPCGEYGFEAATFYRTLKKLSDQVDEIEKNLSDLADETEEIGAQ